MISREHARKIRERIEKAAISLSDDDALEAQELYPIWKVNTERISSIPIFWLPGFASPAESVLR